MGRSPCCDNNGLKKGPWTPEEDAKLTHHIQKHGPGNWRTLPKDAGLERCGKSCRLRWTNYLRPDIKRGRFSFEEEETIIQLHSVLGNKWSSIAARLPGRTDNEIKNYWNTHIRKRLLRMGIDPVTHAPRLDLSDLSSLLMSSSQLKLSNLIRLQTLVNPEALRVALNLLSSSSLQNDQNQLLNSHQQYFQNDDQAPVIQPNHFENIINQQIPSTDLITSSFQNPSQSLQGDHMNQFPVGSTNSTYNQLLFEDTFHNIATDAHHNTTSTSDQSSLPNTYSPSFCYGISDDQITQADFSFDNNSNFQPLNSNNTTPAFITGSTEDERDQGFCSNLLRFEIPEGFDGFDDFI